MQTAQNRFDEFLKSGGEIMMPGYPIFKFEQKDTFLEGILIGARLVKSKDPMKKDSWLYDFEQHNGERVSFWGNYVLDMRFHKIVEGETYGADYIVIWYKGVEVSKKDPTKTYHNFEVAKKPIAERELNATALTDDFEDVV